MIQHGNTGDGYARIGQQVRVAGKYIVGLLGGQMNLMFGSSDVPDYPVGNVRRMVDIDHFEKAVTRAGRASGLALPTWYERPKDRVGAAY